MKIKMNEDIKQALLKSINVEEVFSGSVLYKLTQSIIDDEYEELDSRSHEEIVDMFENSYDMTDYLGWSPNREDLFLKMQAQAWGLATLGFSIDKWTAHFVDYIEYEDGAWEQYQDFMERINNMLEIEIKVLEDLPKKEKDSGADPDDNKKDKYKREEGFWRVANIEREEDFNTLKEAKVVFGENLMMYPHSYHWMAFGWLDENFNFIADDATFVEIVE